MAVTYIPFFRYTLNTLFIAGVNVVGTVLSCSLVAFSFSRVRWHGRDALFVLVLSTMLLPCPVTLIPLYVIFKTLGWVGTYAPLIVPAFFGSAFYIFLLRQFFMTIPHEMDEAARIDGAGYLTHLLPHHPAPVPPGPGRGGHPDLSGQMDRLPAPADLSQRPVDVHALAGLAGVRVDAQRLLGSADGGLGALYDPGDCPIYMRAAQLH